ncbi:hypothetical protein FRC07_002289 [Ceratobasidium sp. 392]|nr:hypothetical protein FRC07_002289 [Ceratobasidium sp. 392]
MSENLNPNSPKRPQRQAARDFAHKLPHLTGTARSEGSQLKGTVAGSSVPRSTSTPQSTQTASTLAQTSNASLKQKGKRKAMDNPPEHALQPEPLSKKMKTSTMSAEEIMAHPYTALNTSSQRDIWLHTALKTLGYTDLTDDMTILQLEMVYNEILSDPDPDPDAEVDEDMPDVDVGVHLGETTSMSRSQPLTGTDHTTIEATFGELPRDLNGKPDLSSISLDDNSQLVGQFTSCSPEPESLCSKNSPITVHANNRQPLLKMPKSQGRDLRRTVLNRTQIQANATQNQSSQALAKGPTSGAVNASTTRQLVAPKLTGKALLHPSPTRQPGSSGLVISASTTGTAAHSTAASSTPGASSSRTPTQPSSATSQKLSPHATARSSSSSHNTSSLRAQTTPLSAPAGATKPNPPGNAQVTGHVSHLVAALSKSRQVASSSGPLRKSAHPAQPDKEEDYEQEDNTGEQLNEEAQAVGLARPTKRQQTQLRNFGLDYEPVVKKTEELMQLRMLTRCPFPEVTHAPAPEGEGQDDENPITWNLFNEWMPECWEKANKLERPDQPPLELKDVHQGWVRLQLSQPRTKLKAHLEGTVPMSYGFQAKKCEANIQLSSDLIHEHAFTYANADNVRTIFRHPCIGDAIYSVFFKDNAIASQYGKHFQIMPIPLIAFTCAIIRHVICEFRDGQWKKESLNAGIDVKWYGRYVARLEQMDRDTLTRLSNIRQDLKALCLGHGGDGEVSDDTERDIDLGSDSEAEDI